MAALRSTCALAALLLGACAYPRASAPAAQPLTPPELAAYEITVDAVQADPADAPLAAALWASVFDALVRAGFKVVNHPPFRNAWELQLSLGHNGLGLKALATLRSDDFYVVDEQAEGADVGAVGQTLVAKLAASQGVADFVRNSGLPQQRVPPM